MTIVHDIKYDGEVHTIKVLQPNGILVIIRMMLPGKYNFGVIGAGPKQKITVIYGQLRINDNVYSTGETCILEPGNLIPVVALEPCGYKAIFE